MSILKKRIPWAVASILAGGHVVWAVFTGRVIALGAKGGHPKYVSYDEMPVFYVIAIIVYIGATLWFARLTFRKSN